MNTTDKLKLRLDVAKFKVLYFVGVVSACGFLVTNFGKFVDFFGNTHFGKYGIVLIVNLLFLYGVAGIVKNVRILTEIGERLKDE